MDPITAIGAAASVITLLETTIKAFHDISSIVSKIRGFPERSQEIIQRCEFDGKTLHDIISLIKANTKLTDTTSDGGEDLQGVFSKLQADLLYIKIELEQWTLDDDNAVKRVAWAFKGEKRLTKIEQDLSRWNQSLYIRFVVLLKKVSGTLNGSSNSLLSIPEILSQNKMRQIATEAEKLDPNTLLKDPDRDNVVLDYSMKKGTVGLGHNTFPVRVQVRDSRSLPPLPKATLESWAAQLAAVLSKALPEMMAILQCCGYFFEGRMAPPDILSGWVFLFSQPSGCSEDSISLDHLVEIPPTHPLNKRFEIARRITAAVVFTHGVGWLHKQICTSNVILYAKQGASVTDESFPKRLGDAFLIGFEMARDRRGPSPRQEYSTWEENIYKHPDRTNWSNLVPYFEPKYDIYSLGVVLLELGLWTPLHKKKETVTRAGHQTETLMFDLLEPGPRKETLLRYASTLESVLGSVYQELVIRCLTVNDSVNTANLVGEVLGNLEKLSTSL